MPTRTRDYMLRYMDEAFEHVGYAVANLRRLADMYCDVHPDLRDQCHEIAVALEEFARLLIQFKEEKM